MDKNAVLELVYYPQKEDCLRQTSKDITVFNSQTRHLAKAMLATMRHYQGIGLAAVQIGYLKRLFVMEIAEHENLPKVFINPQLIEKSDEIIEYEEGCLSIPDYRAVIVRSKGVKIAALSEEGEPFEIELEGLPAICAQHEIDHLNGVLFVDYLSRLKRNRLKQKMLKKV